VELLLSLPFTVHIQSHHFLGQVLGLRHFIWCVAYTPVYVTLSSYRLVK